MKLKRWSVELTGDRPCHRLRYQRRTKRLNEEYVSQEDEEQRISSAKAYMIPAGDEFKNDPRNPLAKSGGAH